ncbi:hypothetical protein ASE03_22095 [Kitasatospora sp. Root187]|nr:MULTISPECIES: sulfatase-like hydrolase/transferase [unclassified Kitasatospora]KQV12392.1 hypothetical protein ASC99_34430 [Kitasatospora sp. Root107]KRB72546.1 hypothetical protein ASE03_22095 [Kitasatospora sp. Root187]
MTGLSQRSRQRVGYEDGVTWDFPITLPGEFRRHGYHTHTVGKMHIWPERQRLGFDDVQLHDGYLHFSKDRSRRPESYDDYVTWFRFHPDHGPYSGSDDLGIDCNSVVARPWDRPEHLHPTNWIAHQAGRWLDRRDPTQPLFLYLSFHRPHPPYDPPRWAFEQYLNLPDHTPPTGDWTDLFEPWRDDLRPDANIAHYPQE